MKKIFILSCSLLVIRAGMMGQQPVKPIGKLTLQQCVETGIANNLQVLQNDLQVQAADVNLKQAKANRLPDLNASLSNGINQGRSIDPFSNSFINQQVNYASYGASSSVVLFNGLSIQNAVKENKFIYQAAKMESQQGKDNLTINIILNFLQVLSNEDLLAQSHTQFDLTKKQADRLEILNKDGAILPSQLSDIKGQLANDQLSIINNENALETSKVNLAQLMNVPYDRSIQLERPTEATLASKYDILPDSIYRAALEKFALVKAVDLRKASAGMAVKVAQGQRYPTLSLDGSVNTNFSNAARQDIFLNTTAVTSTDYVLVNGTPTSVIHQQNNYNSEKIGYGSQLNNNLFNSISLNLRIPIFNAFQARSRVTLAKIDYKNSELQAQTTKTQLGQAIDQAYINMSSAFDRYKTLIEQVSAFNESFHAAEVRYDAGVGTSIDYLTAKNNLDRANVNLISAKYDYMLRTKVLDYYQGKALW